MTAAAGARNLFKVDAGVVHALLQARYYDGGKGEFLSEDPVFLGNPKQQVLSDPQSLNSYAYGNDNPITKSDPTGLEVDLVSRSVYFNGALVGAHTFFMVTPDQPNQIQIDGLAKGMPVFTMGGYPAGNPFNSQLSKSIGTFQGGQETQYVFGNSPIINKVQIIPPNGESDTQFINSLGKAYNDIDLGGLGYAGLGNVPGFYNGNSNNFTRTLGERVGVGAQMNAFNPSPNRATPEGAPGYNAMLPTTSLYRQAVGTLTAVRDYLSQVISKLQK